MSLMQIAQARLGGMNPGHCILVLGADTRHGCGSIHEVFIKAKTPVYELDFRPLVGMRIGVVDFEQPSRIMLILPELAKHACRLFAYSGEQLHAVAKHPLAADMQTRCENTKQKEEYLWKS